MSRLTDLREKRSDVRRKIYLSRSPWAAWRGANCDVCGEPGPDAMHEVLVPRRMTRYNPELQLRSMHEYNCVLVHNVGCHQEAETESRERALIKKQTARYGTEALIEWVTSLPWKDRPNEVINKIKKCEENKE